MAGQKTDQRDVYVGQRIAEQRRKASLTQRRVAESFGMSAAQLQKYEKGTNRISAVHLDIFSRMTGVPLEYFFQGAPRLDDFPQNGFGDSAQQTYRAESNLQSLAEAVAKHVSDHFPDAVKRDIAAAAQVLSKRLSD
ncbi:helix-turn-helix domain-containing protein [Methylobacterium symbioticum]|jgi:transcriptional regulator with XRE-family HTH domain|uniref:HTH cro/C1-type domain-containing protein n=1 Tax=Methylobacterium symbioticum TaxID=2584084 RepID=A0A509E923_9HYPH|nr:helix-turn-helix transcriptional regulator [Methylobacterium symbioticum]VUD70642.1 hypothetical protein MET9862_01213 [Methylobacterium symbioticum]